MSKDKYYYVRKSAPDLMSINEALKNLTEAMKYYDSFIGNNKRFKDISGNVYPEIKSTAHELEYTLTDISMENKTLSDEEYIDKLHRAVYYYFLNIFPAIDIKVTDELIVQIISYFNNMTSEQIVMKFLEICYGVPFVETTLNGTSSIEWVELIYPDNGKITNDDLDFFSCSFFGNLIALEVSAKKCTEKEFLHENSHSHLLFTYATSNMTLALDYLANDLGVDPLENKLIK